MREHTRLGLSVNILAAAVYFAAFFGGYVPAFFMAGYILLFENDRWLRKSGVKSIALLAAFGVLTTAISFIPDLLSLLDLLVALLGGSVQYSGVNSLIDIFLKAAGMVRTALFLLLGIGALGHRTVSVPFIDGMVERHMCGR